MTCKIVYTLEDLKKVYDEDSWGVKGQWNTHTRVHEGHIGCGRIARKRADWLMGVYWANCAAAIYQVAGEATQSDDPEPLQHNINHMREFCDVLFISKGDYFPFLKYKDYLNKEMEKDFPPSYLEETGLISSVWCRSTLKFALFVKVLMHEIYNIKIDFQISSGRERWRSAGKYKQWNMDRFGLDLMLIDPITDKFGNNYSGMKEKVPKHLLDRIDKQLLFPHYRTIEEVEQNIKDIDGLHVSDFVLEDGWVQCRFYFSPDQWWAEGFRCK